MTELFKQLRRWGRYGLQTCAHVVLTSARDEDVSRFYERGETLRHTQPVTEGMANLARELRELRESLTAHPMGAPVVEPASLSAPANPTPIATPKKAWGVFEPHIARKGPVNNAYLQLYIWRTAMPAAVSESYPDTPEGLEAARARRDAVDKEYPAQSPQRKPFAAIEPPESLPTRTDPSTPPVPEIKAGSAKAVPGEPSIYEVARKDGLRTYRVQITRKTGSFAKSFGTLSAAKAARDKAMAAMPAMTPSESGKVGRALQTANTRKGNTPDLDRLKTLVQAATALPAYTPELPTFSADGGAPEPAPTDDMGVDEEEIGNMRMMVNHYAHFGWKGYTDSLCHPSRVATFGMLIGELETETHGELERLPEKSKAFSVADARKELENRLRNLREMRAIYKTYAKAPVTP